MDDLIERLEAATGPCRELDAEVFASVYPDKVPGPIVESGYGWRYDKGHWWLATGEDARTPPKCVFPGRYTASIDAALTLVPEGWGYTLCTQPPDHKPWASVVEWQPDDKGKMWTGNHMARSGEVKASTPAHAICIAALKARRA